MIGRLRERLTVQREIRTPDSSGGFAVSWQDIPADPEVFAEIAPLTFREELRFRQIATRATHRIIIRHRVDITTDMRLTDGTRIYNIISLLPRDSRLEYLVIIAEVRAP